MPRPILPLFLTLISLLDAKVSIFAHYFGQPEFIKYQYLFFQKNMLDDYEFVVFEDSRDSHTSLQIQRECHKYGVKYIRIPPHEFTHPKLPLRDSYISLNAPSFQCCVATQYIYDHHVAPSNNICLILDNDIFLLSPFSIEHYLGEHAFAYSRQTKKNGSAEVNYMLPNFVIFNSLRLPEKELIDFNMGRIDNVLTDSGGFTHFYVLRHDDLGKRLPNYYLWSISSNLKERFGDLCPLMFHSEDWSSHFFLEKDTFLHIRMGSNWSNHPKYPQMTQEIRTLFDTLLRD